MGIIVWLSLFKFNWLRRCRLCGGRGSKCLCRRQSLALEHIFFLEERKNKFGIHNFSHVSDTMITSSSTMFTNSTNGVENPSSKMSSAPVVMRDDGSFITSDVNPTDYYCQPPGLSWDNSGELLTPRMDKKPGGHHPTPSRSSKGSVMTDVSTTTLVRKYSRHKVRHNGDTDRQPSITEVMAGEYILYTEDNIPVVLPHRQRHKQLVSHNWRQLRAQSTSTNMVTTHKGEPGVSFQFYGRSGSNVPTASPVSTLMLSNKSSTTDSIMIGSSSISSMGVSSTGVSQYSDRVSLETNFGSLNPHLSNTGRLLESGYAPSIKENDEAQALEKLTGWFHASSVSTQDSFLLSR